MKKNKKKFDPKYDIEISVGDKYSLRTSVWVFENIMRSMKNKNVGSGMIFDYNSPSYYFGARTKIKIVEIQGDYVKIERVVKNFYGRNDCGWMYLPQESRNSHVLGGTKPPKEVINDVLKMLEWS